MYLLIGAIVQLFSAHVPTQYVRHTNVMVADISRSGCNWMYDVVVEVYRLPIRKGCLSIEFTGRWESAISKEDDVIIRLNDSP